MHHQRHSLAVIGLFYSRRAQQSAAASFPLSLRNFREPFVTKSLGQNRTLFGIKTSAILPQNAPFCTEKFLEVIPLDPGAGEATSLAHTPVHHHPNLTSPTFKYLPQSTAQLRTIINKGAWPFNHCYSTVEVLQFLVLHDPKVDDFQTVISSSLTKDNFS